LILFASINQVIGCEDWVFAPVKWLAGKIAYNVSSKTLNPTLSICLHWVCQNRCQLVPGHWLVISHGDINVLSDYQLLSVVTSVPVLSHLPTDVHH